MALSSKFSTALPVIVVASGGWPARQVDGNGVAIDDGTTVYSVAKPVVLVDSTGATETGKYVYSNVRKITLSATGHPVVRVDENGVVSTVSLNSPLSGGGGSPALDFNVSSNSMYTSLLAL